MTHDVCTLQDVASSYPPVGYLNSHQLAYVEYLFKYHAWSHLKLEGSYVGRFVSFEKCFPSSSNKVLQSNVLYPEIYVNKSFINTK